MLFLSRHQRDLLRGVVESRPVVRTRAAKQEQLISLKNEITITITIYNLQLQLKNGFEN